MLFLGGAGGSLRAGVTDNPVLLTRAIKQALVNVTCGGAPAYVWPGGGITVMVDVARMPDRSFGTVPTPAIVAPIEFSMRLDDYRALGGHMDYVRSLETCSRAAPGTTTARRPRAAGPSSPRPIRGRSASRRCSADADDRDSRARCLRRRPLAFPARPDRHRDRRRRRGRRGRRGA